MPGLLGDLKFKGDLGVKVIRARPTLWQRILDFFYRG